MSRRVRKSRTNFNSSVVVQTGLRRRASIWNGFEPASSELRDATRHVVNPPLFSQVVRSMVQLLSYGPVIVMWSSYCHVVQLVSCDPVIVIWSSYCHVVQLLSCGPLIVMWSSYCHVVQLLSCGPVIVM